MGRKVIAWAVPATLVAALIWTFLPHDQAGSPPAGRNPAAHAPVAPPASPGIGDATPYAEIRQGDFQGTDAAGGQRWRIVADDVTMVHNTETVVLRHLRATLYQKGGGTITVTGAQGRFETKTHEIEIEGQVHGTSSNGRELFADRLRWVPGTGRVTGSGHIRLVQARFTMFADSMTSDTALGETRFFGHVHAASR